MKFAYAVQVDTVLAFHAVTGCDSVSVQLPAWQVFRQHHADPIGLGKGTFTENLVISTEKFIFKMSGVPEPRE